MLSNVLFRKEFKLLKKLSVLVRDKNEISDNLKY